jgi:hypothetical protein
VSEASDQKMWNMNRLYFWMEAMLNAGARIDRSDSEQRLS